MKSFFLQMIAFLGWITLYGCAPPPITPTPDFPYPCDGVFKDQSVSKEDIMKVQKAHEIWLKNPKAAEGGRANFCGAKLSQAKFQKANLESAFLHMAMLAGANFSGATLTDAQLQGSNLSSTDFSDTHLTKADLNHAMLHGARFQRAEFQETTLRHAMLFQTTFKSCDLREAIGLTQAQINMACFDKDSKLPEGLDRPEPCPDKPSY